MQVGNSGEQETKFILKKKVVFYCGIVRAVGMVWCGMVYIYMYEVYVRFLLSNFPHKKKKESEKNIERFSPAAYHRNWIVHVFFLPKGETRKRNATKYAGGHLVLQCTKYLPEEAKTMHTHTYIRLR